ncbi:g5311 [Coccomyxa elongata]
MHRRSFLADLPLLALFVSASGLSDVKELRQQGASNVHSTTFARNLLNFPGHGPHGEQNHGAPSIPFHHDHHDRHLFSSHDGPDFHKKEHSAPYIPFHHDHHARHLFGHDSPHSDSDWIRKSVIS